MRPYNLLVILGPTASGKTALAARVAGCIDGEIISADSRQVYRGMDIGTGKDYADYTINGRQIPVHLVDIADAGYQYNVYEYQRDFLAALKDIRLRGKFPILCGGSGLYIEAVLDNYQLIKVPVNEELRANLEKKSLAELVEILKGFKPNLHNITDIVNEKRAVRAIEIEAYYAGNPGYHTEMPDLQMLVTGIMTGVDTRRKMITERLHRRLCEGMIDEVRLLLDKGLKPGELIYYGLEYKFITLYLTGGITYLEMAEQLNTAIHQFAKRQMTWFRRMERRGTVIHWMDGNLPLEEKVSLILKMLNFQ